MDEDKNKEQEDKKELMMPVLLTGLAGIPRPLTDEQRAWLLEED